MRNNLGETTIELEFFQTYTLGSNDPCKLALNSSNSPFLKINTMNLLLVK